MKEYSILEEATVVVQNQLAMMEALHEAKKFRMDARSRLICRCPSCRNESEETLAWLKTIRNHEESPA